MENPRSVGGQRVREIHVRGGLVRAALHSHGRRGRALGPARVRLGEARWNRARQREQFRPAQEVARRAARAECEEQGRAVGDGHVLVHPVLVLRGRRRHGRPRRARRRPDGPREPRPFQMA
eukprot:3315891-Pyramimonas_sp.AAC.1